MARDAHITLEPYTLERCLKFWRGYTADPAMWAEPYAYHEDKVKDYYKQKVLQPDRVFFAVCYQGETVGEIQLKRIDRAGKHATLSVHLSDDRYKNRGWGTQAIEMTIAYAFTTLGLDTIYADAVHRNTRSRHVLEKIGFVLTHEDDILRYYKLRKQEPAG